MKKIALLGVVMFAFLTGLLSTHYQARANADVGQCMGDCASDQGICISQCDGDGQCIGNCSATHGRCVSRCH